MKLTDSDRLAVAKVLAKTLPKWEQRERAVAAARLKDVQLSGKPLFVWQAILEEADEQGKMDSLMRALEKINPDDPSLSRFLAGYQEGRILLPIPQWVRVVSGAVVVGLLIFAVSSLLGDGEEEADLEEQISKAELALEAEDQKNANAEPKGAKTPPEEPAISSEAQQAAEVTEEPEAMPMGEAEVVDTPESVEPTPEPEPEPEPTPEPVRRAPEPPVRPTSSASSKPQPCAEASGYAYLGSNGELAAGDVWVVPQGTNVRADFPRPENRWDSRTAVQCVLPKGAKVTLQRDATPVDGGAYWLWIEAGSVER